MRRLNKNLKRILTGLAHQDAGEFLSMRDKMSVLGYGSKSTRKPIDAVNKPRDLKETKRIALICNRDDLNAALEYAIDACRSQDAGIDLLIDDTVDTETLSLLERKIRGAGIGCDRFKLGATAVESLVDFIHCRATLVFLVARSDDATVRTLMEEVIPKHESRISVPLVLIADRLKTSKYERSNRAIRSK